LGSICREWCRGQHSNLHALSDIEWQESTEDHAAPMANRNQTFFKNKGINGRNLWTLITVPICLAVAALMTTKDLSRADEISSMIQFSVRCSVPWLYLAFAASSFRVLFPGPFSLWVLRNRRILGLCFASGMAWQLFFIVWMVAGHWSYYIEEVYLFADIANQIPGYLILFAMTATSFRKGRGWISPRQWKFLHKGGIYFLWGTVWVTYWYEIAYYNDRQFIDYIYFWAGLLAFGSRVVAFIKPRWVRATA
jgi:hypothetical protein